MQRSMTLLVVLAVLLVGCTTTSPDPSPTTVPPSPTTASPDATPSTPPPGRVAVVVAPAPAVVAETAESGSRRLVRLLDGADLRVVTADEPSFVVDLAGFFAAEGYDLVCVVGAGAEAAVREVAPSAPSTRFCASPARARDMPDNVLPIDLRTQEVGYVAGVALAADRPEAPTALVTSPTTWATARVAGGMAAGLVAGGMSTPDIRMVGPARDEETVVEELQAHLVDGVVGVASWTGELDAAVREVLEGFPLPPPVSDGPTATAGAEPAPSPTATASEDRFAGLVAGPEVRPEDDEALADLVLAVVELHLEAAVELAIERHVEGWDASPASVGFAEGAFRVEAGESERASAVASAVEDVVAAIREGRLEIPAE